MGTRLATLLTVIINLIGFNMRKEIDCPVLMVLVVVACPRTHPQFMNSSGSVSNMSVTVQLSYHILLRVDFDCFQFTAYTAFALGSFFMVLRM